MLQRLIALVAIGLLAAAAFAAGAAQKPIVIGKHAVRGWNFHNAAAVVTPDQVDEQPHPAFRLRTVCGFDPRNFPPDQENRT